MLDVAALIDVEILDNPESILERRLIAEYLRGKGFDLADLHFLPAQTAESLLKEACRYATLRLAEIEARSKFRQKIEAPL